VSFVDRMAAAEAIAARYRAGEIDRETAEVEIFLAWEGTLAATDNAVRSYLNDWHPAPKED
jgi:hypothetical protein